MVYFFAANKLAIYVLVLEGQHFILKIKRQKQLQYEFVDLFSYRIDM